jgi:hypothetical protein
LDFSSNPRNDLSQHYLCFVDAGETNGCFGRDRHRDQIARIGSQIIIGDRFRFRAAPRLLSGPHELERPDKAEPDAVKFGLRGLIVPPELAQCCGRQPKTSRIGLVDGHAGSRSIGAVSTAAKSFFAQAFDALKVGDRRAAAILLERQLREGNTARKNLLSVFQLAANIGEIDTAIEALRRAVVPGSLDSLLAYWAALAINGRTPEAIADIQKQPASVRNQPAVLHFRGTAANQFGRLEEAQQLFRQALNAAPGAMRTWFALAMVKTFKPGDPDLAAMERLERGSAPPGPRASLCFGLGKAYEDCGDVDRAFTFYSRGASLQRGPGTFDSGEFGRIADQIIREYTPDNLAKLAPSTLEGQRSLFVTGLPRSGTTLVAQIIRGHSAVSNGDEVNLFGSALVPTLGIGVNDALAYQERSSHSDPWGEIGRDYSHFIDMRFQQPGLVVDKSLGQSLTIGLMLHALPSARIAWLRRSPDDVALSCFRTYFPVGLPWTLSLADIADHMRIEDRLFEHWRSVFTDRILVVPYEELVQAPAAWAEKLQQHFGLPIEEGIESRSKAGRAIGSASVNQAREPISTARIGQSAAFERHLKPFRDRYYA